MSGDGLVIGLGGAALIVIVSGISLTRGGKPFGTAVLSAHKVVALAAVVAIGVAVYDAARLGPLSRVALTATGIVAVLNLTSFVSGGVVSAMDAAPKWVTWLHRIGSWLTLLITAWWAVLFLS